MKENIFKFAEKYYELLDSHASLEELLGFFKEDKFQIIEGDMIIDNFEKYSLWYENTKKQFSSRKHIINDIQIKEENNLFYVEISMDFKGELSSGKDIYLKNATVLWTLVLFENKFRIKKYEIKI